MWDHNKDLIFERAEPILSDPATAKYVWGVGFHWYSGDEFENLAKVHDAFRTRIFSLPKDARKVAFDWVRGISGNVMPTTSSAT